MKFPNLGSDDVIIPGMANLSFNIELNKFPQARLKRSMRLPYQMVSNFQSLVMAIALKKIAEIVSNKRTAINGATFCTKFSSSLFISQNGLHSGLSLFCFSGFLFRYTIGEG